MKINSSITAWVAGFRSTWSRLGTARPSRMLVASASAASVLATSIFAWIAGWGGATLVLVLFAGIVAVLVGFALLRLYRRGAQSRIEGDRLGQNMSDAFDTMRSRGEDRYEQPFFLLMGESSGGKTKSVELAGLDLPVGKIMDAGDGIVGTAGCNWWFTGHGTILDTGGCYVIDPEARDAPGDGDDRATRGVDPNASDSSAWADFLLRLRRYKSDTPINGAIVAIPCSSLIHDSDDLLRAKAGRLRDALNDVQDKIGVRFPVTVLLTKADRVRGFREFFAALRDDRRRQLLGWARPNDRSEERFAAEREIPEAFAAINEQLRQFRLEMLYQHGVDPGSATSDRIIRFPAELDSLAEPLERYLQTMFYPGEIRPASAKPLLRGFYFASARQDHHVCVSALRDLVDANPPRDGAAPAPADAGQPDRARDLERPDSCAYFIGDFYRGKVLREAGLIQPTGTTLRRRRIARRVSQAALLAVGLTALAAVGGDVRRTMASDDALRTLLADTRSGDPAAHVAVLDELLDRDGGAGLVTRLDRGALLQAGWLNDAMASKQSDLAQPLLDLAAELAFNAPAARTELTRAFAVREPNAEQLEKLDDARLAQHATLAAAVLARPEEALARRDGSADAGLILTGADRAQFSEWFDALAQATGARSSQTNHWRRWAQTLVRSEHLQPTAGVIRARAFDSTLDRHWAAVLGRWRVYFKPEASRLGWPSLPAGKLTPFQAAVVERDLAAEDDALATLEQLRHILNAVDARRAGDSLGEAQLCTREQAQAMVDAYAEVRRLTERLHLAGGEFEASLDPNWSAKRAGEIDAFARAKRDHFERILLETIRSNNADQVRQALGFATETFGPGKLYKGSRAFWDIDHVDHPSPSAALSTALDDVGRLGGDEEAAAAVVHAFLGRLQTIANRAGPSGPAALSAFLRQPPAGESGRPTVDQVAVTVTEIERCRQLIRSGLNGAERARSLQVFDRMAQRATDHIASAWATPGESERGGTSIANAERVHALLDGQPPAADVEATARRRQDQRVALLETPAFDDTPIGEIVARFVVDEPTNPYTRAFDDGVALPAATAQVDRVIAALQSAIADHEGQMFAWLLASADDPAVQRAFGRAGTSHNQASGGGPAELPVRGRTRQGAVVRGAPSGDAGGLARRRRDVVGRGRRAGADAVDLPRRLAVGRRGGRRRFATRARRPILADVGQLHRAFPKPGPVRQRDGRPLLRRQGAGRADEPASRRLRERPDRRRRVPHRDLEWRVERDGRDRI